MPRGFVYEGETWFPLEFNLADGPVTSIRTSDTDPAVGFDGTGFWLTDSSGKKAIFLTSNGLELLASADLNNAPSINRIQWDRSSDGAMVADMFTYFGPFSGHNESALTIEAEYPGFSGKGAIVLTANDTGGTTVQAFAGNAQLIILDSNGNTPWLQLVGNGFRRVNFGTGTVTFPNTAVSNISTLAHGLGKVPNGIYAIADDGSGEWFTTFNYTSTTFQIRANFFVTVNATLPFAWVGFA